MHAGMSRHWYAKKFSDLYRLEIFGMYIHVLVESLQNLISVHAE